MKNEICCTLKLKLDSILTTFGLSGSASNQLGAMNRSTANHDFVPALEIGVTRISPQRVNNRFALWTALPDPSTALLLGLGVRNGE